MLIERKVFLPKLDHLEAEGKVLKQIKEKKYADKYPSQNQPVHLIGVEFSKKKRNVVGFEVESPG
ncbi:MAG: PD-(D/E)XK nuclease domain-containing protein [Azoarcus sp.]|nr:PD-(D/E)XK nuclease domain-containing protein [Azoarcus sp.]